MLIGWIEPQNGACQLQWYHIVVNSKVFHARVSVDPSDYLRGEYTAVCIETGDTAQGTSIEGAVEMVQYAVEARLQKETPREPVQ